MGCIWNLRSWGVHLTTESQQVINMKIKIAAFIALFLTAMAVYAGCTTQVVSGPDGKTLTCITCCDAQGKNCVTNCY